MAKGGECKRDWKGKEKGVEFRPGSVWKDSMGEFFFNGEEQSIVLHIEKVEKN